MNMYLDYAASRIINLIGSAFTKPAATIFTLHRVYSPEHDSLPICDELMVEPEFLDRFIKTCRQRGYDFISMDELVSGLLSGKSHNAFVISIDDGYKDIYTNAYPVLKSNNVPFIFYISTSFPDKTAVLWWYELEELLMKNDVITLADGKKIPCDTLSKKLEAFGTLRRMVLRMGRNFQEGIPRMLPGYEINLSFPKNSLMVDWGDIVAMSKDELCTIGAHTENHFGLRFESEENVLHDFLLCKKKIENKTGMPVKHFSFPYGTVYSVGCREIHLAAKAGFTTAVTTLPRACHSYHKHMLHCLPRVNFTERYVVEKYNI